MKHLQDIKDWNKFLDDPLMIAQKVDGTAIIVKYENKQIKFFGREGNKELNLIQRSLTDLYEDAIEFLKPKVERFLKKEGQLLSFEYFPDKIKPVIPVIIKPKNNLILLYTDKINQSIKTIAKILDVSEQPVIFEGLLSKKQKEFILTRNFNPETIIELNPTFKFVINPTKMEGLILKNLKTKETYKMTNFEFTETIKSKKKESKDNIDKEYNELLMKLVLNFHIDVPLNYKYSPENYLEVMFNNIDKQQTEIIKKNNKNFIEFNNNKIEDFINWKMYPQNIQKNMKLYSWFRDFVWLLISNYSKNRKRVISGIDKETFDKYLNKVKKLLQENTSKRLKNYLICRVWN